MSYSVVGPVGKRWPLDGFYPAPILYMSLCIITSPTAKFSSSAALCSCVSADFCWAHLAWLKSLRFSYIFQLQCCLLPLGKKKKKKHRAVWLKSEIKLLTDLIYIFNVDFMIWPLVSDSEVGYIEIFSGSNWCFLKEEGYYTDTLSHFVRKVSWCPSTCC